MLAKIGPMSPHVSMKLVVSRKMNDAEGIDDGPAKKPREKGKTMTPKTSRKYKREKTLTQKPPGIATQSLPWEIVFAQIQNLIRLPLGTAMESQPYPG